MPAYRVYGAKFSGCSLILGEDRCRIDDFPALYGHNRAQLERLKQVGMGDRYIARPATTAADLCTRAALNICEGLSMPVTDVGAIVSVTQTPDYPMPGNAHVVHAKLGCGPDTAAVDLAMGCSGFIYGLWVAASMAAAGQHAVLLLAGDTLNRHVGQRDAVAAPLFSDAGSAALIHPSPEGTMSFMLKADGTGLAGLHIPAGGARNPSTAETREEQLGEDGNYRSAEQVAMDGLGIFRFSVVEQPRLLRDILEYARMAATDIDYFFLHQANKLIVDTIAKKTGIPADKMPSWIFSRYGNLNSASLPGVLCAVLGELPLQKKLQLVLQGYGTGLSWGACQLALGVNTVWLPPQVYAGL